MRASIEIGVIKTDGNYLAAAKIGGKEFMGQLNTSPTNAIYSLLQDLGGATGRFNSLTVKTAIELMAQGTTFDAVIPVSHFDPDGKEHSEHEHRTGDKK